MKADPDGVVLVVMFNQNMAESRTPKSATILIHKKDDMDILDE